MRNLFFISTLSASLLLLSCSEKDTKNHGPIVLGDSATIVTETEDKYLQDMVPDLRMVAPPAPSRTDTPKYEAPQPTAATPTAAQAGFTIDFGDMVFQLASINPQQDGKGFAGKSSAALSAPAANFQPSTLSLREGSLTRVQQRIQTGVIMKESNPVLILSDLGTVSSNWETLKTNGNSVDIQALANPAFDKKLTNAAIKNAVQKAARGARLSTKEQQELVNKVSKVNAANEAPLAIVLKNVVWRVEGKDAKGKPFSREIRIDVAR